MAKQIGVLKLKGTVGDITFYKSKNGYLAQAKSSLDKSRVANDPAFARTRENGVEFGAAIGSGKLLRDAIRPLMMKASDSRVVSRLVKLMTEIKGMDATSARGQRNVGIAIALPAAKALLKGFNFNSRAILSAVLFKPYTVTTATGNIQIPNLIPVQAIAFPQGATHLTLSSAWARVDFVAGTYDVQYSPPLNLPIDGTSTSVSLTPAAVPSGTGTDLYLLEIEFFQEVNAVQYPLNNNAFNALSMVEVQ